MAIEQRYSNFQKAKTLSNYTLDSADHILTKQEDGRLGYIDASDITSYINLRTFQKLGWARYDDTQYTTGSVFSLPILSGELVLPNNGGNTINDHIYSAVEFYDSTTKKVQVENINDVYVTTITFKAKTGNANGTYIRLQLDSTTGTPYERVGKDLFFGKGNNVWHEFHEVFQYYGDSDFKLNGNEWNVQAFGADCQIADIIYFIQRTQNHLI